MNLGSSRLRGLALGVTLVLLFLASCGGSSSSSNASGSTGSVTCSDDATELGVSEGKLCADSGFRLSTNDFSFPNWSGIEGSTDDLNTNTMIRLFGASTVCSTGTTANDCVLNPAAQSTVDQWSAALDGGRCEGMSTLSLRYFLGLQNPSETESGKSETSSLQRPKLELDQEINTWWATQFMPEVRAAAAESRKLEPTALVAELVQGLKNKKGYTIGIYGNGYGHSVTPFAVTKSGSIFSIHIYDNNYPGKAAAIAVDESTNKWSYDEAAVNPDGEGSKWSGGKGTIELTPMSVRSGPFSDEFGAISDGVKGNAILGMAVKSAKGQPAAGLLVTTASGKHVGVLNAQQVNDISGATYTVGKGGLGTSLVTLELPDMTEAFSVQVVSASTAPDTVKRNVTLSVTTSNGSRTQISSQRALDTSPLPNIASAEITVNPESGVAVSPRVDSDVTVSNNKDKVVVRVPMNGKLMSAPTQDGPKVTSNDASGNEITNKTMKQAAVRRAAADGATATTHTSVQPSVSSTQVMRSSTTMSTVVRRNTSTTLNIVGTNSTTVAANKPSGSSTSTTVKRPISTSSSTVVPRTTTIVERSTTTTVERTTTTVERSTTTTTIRRPPASTTTTMAVP